MADGRQQRASTSVSVDVAEDDERDEKDDVENQRAVSDILAE